MKNGYYKKYIKKLIDFNPTEITIKRITKVDDGFGGVTETPNEVVETVAFYDSKGRREVISDYGKTYTGISITKMLAEYDTEIYKDEKFTANGTEYKVFHVQPYLDVCKQIEVEVIK